MNQYSSIFGQILQFFPRTEFEQAVRKTGSEFHAKGFTSWQQFVAMMFCQLGQAHSLREICQGLESCLGKVRFFASTKRPSVLQLCATMFDWTKFRRAKGGVKLHLILDHEGYIPQFVHITQGKRHEVNVLREL